MKWYCNVKRKNTYARTRTVCYGFSDSNSNAHETHIHVYIHASTLYFRTRKPTCFRILFVHVGNILLEKL